jgi:hypothetical protein
MQKGIITSYVLVFGAIFLLILGSTLGFILLQLKQSAQRAAWAESLNVAEAGLNYYRWCLNNEVEGSCSTQKEYTDPAGNPIGKFSLEVSSQTQCGETSRKEITSSGWTYDFPAVARKVKAIYARESVAEYAYLLNDNVWAGADREIRGLYHSNGGIRMDGENQSLVTSAKETWLCTESFGCDPPEEKPGVFTTTDNSNPDLFNFPVTPFDFTGITIDLAEIKSLTEPYPEQYYWPKVTNIDPEGKGYHVIFNQGGSFDVWIITELEPTYAYSLEEGWHYDYFEIKNEYQYKGPITIDPGCSVIFFEENIWPEGEVKGRVTVASANLIDPNEDTDVILPGNINYTVLDGSDGLGLIGERNILISPDSPDQMELRGIFVAQKGHFGRNLYWGNIKESLEINGSIVSNGRVGTKWSSGGQIVSGYLKRENYIDSNLIYNPPPFVPYTTSDFELIGWEELE